MISAFQHSSTPLSCHSETSDAHLASSDRGRLGRCSNLPTNDCAMVTGPTFTCSYSNHGLKINIKISFNVLTPSPPSKVTRMIVDSIRVELTNISWVANPRGCCGAPYLDNYLARCRNVERIPLIVMMLCIHTLLDVASLCVIFNSTAHTLLRLWT